MESVSANQPQTEVESVSANQPQTEVESVTPIESDLISKDSIVESADDNINQVFERSNTGVTSMDRNIIETEATNQVELDPISEDSIVDSPTENSNQEHETEVLESES